MGIVLKRLIYLVFVLVIGLVALPKDLIAEGSDSFELQPAYYDQQREYQWSEQLTQYSKTLVGKRTGQCVTAVRNYFGIPKSAVSGWARTTKPNSQTPKVGSVIVLSMSKYGHVGIVISKTDTIVTYFDSNGDFRQRGAIRTIRIDDKRIKGYLII